MTYLTKIYYTKSIIDDKKVRIKFIELDDLCVNLENEEYIIKCDKDFLDLLFVKEHVVESIFSREKTLQEFSKKLKFLIDAFGHEKVLRLL